MGDASPKLAGALRLEGRRLGRYEVLAQVGSGGMASVWAARVTGVAGFSRVVALKVLHPHMAHEEDLVAMFLDEATLAARLRHPNVVATLDVHAGDDDGLWYLVMELVEGDHLGTLIARAAKRGERIPRPVALRIVLDALAGLGAAHALEDESGKSAGLVHRDVSPHNVLVGVDGVSRIGDFGVAKAEARLVATREGLVKGKLAYMAPEQASSGAADARSDLFAMGVVLWETLLGKRLFRGDTNAETLSKILVETLPHVGDVDPTLAPFDAVVARALERDPAARFQTAEAMGAAIEAAAPAIGGVASSREVAAVVTSLVGDRVRALRARLRAPLDVPVLPPELTPTPVSEEERTISAKRVSREAPPPRQRAKLAWGIAAGIVALGAGIAVAAALHAFDGGAARGATTTVMHADAGTSSDEPVEASTLHGAHDATPTLEHGDAPLSPDPDLALAPTVVLRLRIDAGGRVADAHVYRPRADLEAFESAALVAVRSWTFAPARRAGARVDCWTSWPVAFRRLDGPVTVLRVKGSDTMGAQLVPDLARAFRATRPDVRVDVEALGSATAFVGLFDGSADLGCASRAVNEPELDDARRLGLVLEELVVGYDGVAVIVPRESGVRALALADVGRVFSGGVDDLAALGGPPGAPVLYGRPAYSGTHAFFADRVLGGAAFAPGAHELEHNDEIVRAVAGDAHGIGYVGASGLDDTVRALAVSPEPGRPAVEPTAATIRDGTYPVSRPLLVYTRGTPRGATRDFLRFVLSPDGRAIVARDGFAPSDVDADVALPRLAEGTRADPGRPAAIRVDFDRGSDALDGRARDALRPAVEWLREDGHHALVVGHADAEGDAVHARSISAARATAVRDRLVRAGADPSRIEVEGVGDTAPLATNTTDRGRAQNRAAEVLLLGEP